LSNRGKGHRKGGSGPKRPDRGGGTGAALGTQVLRYSGIHGIGMVLGNAVTFASTIVIANFSNPDEFGQLGLLLFFAGLLTVLFTLASKQGTLKRTFGGDDDDDDDDDEDDEEIATSPKRSLGTGLVTITIVSVIGTGLLWVGWFGFNGGSALGANSRAAMAIVSTHLAASAGAFTWMALEWWTRGKPSVLGMISGAVAGLGGLPQIAIRT